MPIVVKVRLFAVLRERAGTPTLELELPDGARVADALEQVRDIAGGLHVVMAVNRVYAEPDQILAAGDELALIPPVSGGARPHVRISADPLSIDAVSALVRDPRAGAVVVFAGVTREIGQLDYEAYVEMAQEQIESIAARAVERHGLCRAAVEHRIGAVPLSEPSVLVAASAPHRGAAFAGAREMIDEVKARAPIWKREERRGWVAGAPPPAGAPSHD